MIPIHATTDTCGAELHIFIYSLEIMAYPTNCINLGTLGSRVKLVQPHPARLPCKINFTYNVNVCCPMMDFAYVFSSGSSIQFAISWLFHDYMHMISCMRLGGPVVEGKPSYQCCEHTSDVGTRLTCAHGRLAHTSYVRTRATWAQERRAHTSCDYANVETWIRLVQIRLVVQKDSDSTVI